VAAKVAEEAKRAGGSVLAGDAVRDWGRAGGWERGLGWVAAVAVVAGLWFAFGVAPEDAVQGNVQRIMYLHVPMAWSAYLAVIVVFVASLGYLVRRGPRWDAVAHASAELGVLFTGLALVGGSIWGKPTWGVWWTWDPRITTTTILFLIYVGYLMLRALVEDPGKAARYAAVVGIIGALDLPLVHFSVLWWRTLHQPPSVIRPGGPTMATGMLVALLVNVLAYTILYLYLLAKRTRLERLRQAEQAAMAAAG
jgi:heme exporter protein C